MDVLEERESGGVGAPLVDCERKTTSKSHQDIKG